LPQKPSITAILKAAKFRTIHISLFLANIYLPLIETCLLLFLIQYLRFRELFFFFFTFNILNNYNSPCNNIVNNLNLAVEFNIGMRENEKENCLCGFLYSLGPRVVLGSRTIQDEIDRIS